MVTHYGSMLYVVPLLSFKVSLGALPCGLGQRCILIDRNEVCPYKGSDDARRSMRRMEGSIGSMETTTRTSGPERG